MAIYEKPHRRDFAGAAGEFWHGLSFEELARLQGVKPVDRIETVLGGWPAEELEDGFEAELADWRRQSSGISPRREVERHGFRPTKRWRPSAQRRA